MMNFKSSRLTAMILVVLMVFSTTVTSFADELPEEEAQPKAAAEEVEEEKEPEAVPEEEPEPEPQPEPEPVKEEAPVQEPEQQQAQTAPQTETAAAENSQAGETQDIQTEEAAEDDENGLELNAGLSDGTYKPDSFTFEGGTGKAKVTCDKVIVKNGEATAAFKASSDNMTHFYMGTVSSDAEDTSIYNPSTDTCGQDVYKISKNIAYVPVTLNEKKPFAGRSVAMTEPHWIQYYYTLALSDDAEKISDDTTIPEEEETDPDPSGDKDKDKDKDKDSSKSKKLKDGTYKVKATTDRKMFYLYPKEKDPATVILVKKNGKMTATITLTGSGYDYVYMGTPAQAKKAGKSKWIKFKKKSGYYTFKIPVSKLDKKLPITPHSKKYESDGDPSTDPWRPDKWIKFYSKGAKKVKDGTSIKTKGKASNRNANTKGGNTKGKNDGKAATQSKYKDDSGKSTSAVNNSTGLKDGVYSPDRFSWSGGSGRLAYIRCNKITVKGGKAIATIEFASSKYDSLKANGRVYSRSGGGNSTFNIPVKLNANNTIIGRTTAMSQPHWIKYTIFIYKKGAGGAGKGGKSTEEGDDGHLTSTKKLSSKAPDLMGLEFDKEVEVKYAKYFKIYKYEQGITLIEVDQTRDTALYKEEEKKSGSDKKADAEKQDDGSQGTVEYDDDGNIIAQSQNEIAEGLYQNNIVNYLIVPEDVEIPAGLDKDCIIIKQPADSTFMSSEAALEMLSELSALDNIKTAGFDEKDIKNKDFMQAVKDEKAELAGTAEKPEYAKLVKTKANFAVLPSETLPEALDKEPTEEEKKESEEKTEAVAVLQKRFAALAVPMLIDRSEHEKNNYASEEWIKVYGAIYGKADEADKAFEEFTKNNEKKKNQ